MGIKALLHALCAGAVAVTAGSALAQTETLSVKIGVLTDLSGLYADTNGNGSVTATRMAIEDYRAAGGTVKAEVVSADHQNKADIGSVITREWFDEGGIDAVVDVPNSAVALSVTELARQKNKVFMNSGASSSDFTGKYCSLNSIHWTYDTYALATGTSRAVVASGGNPYAHSRDRMTEALGLLLRAGAGAGTLRGDAEPADVLAGLSGVSLVAGEPAQRAQAGRLLDLLVDGLRFGTTGSG